MNGLASLEPEMLEATAAQLSDQYWRLNHLYRVVNEEKQAVDFVMRPVQLAMYDGLWTRNIILKSRQHGFTTFMCVLELDHVLWNDHASAGVIAHTLPDAIKIFRNKIKFAYDNLAPWVKAIAPKPVKETTDEYVFDNGSSISVSTSFRGGTMSVLHVSEMGKIAAKHPHKAEEIITGAFEAVPQDGLITVESTAEGNHGAFKDMVDQAMALEHQARDLTRLDFKLHFVPWWKDPKNKLTVEETLSTPINQRMQDYFAALKTDWSIALTPRQKAWYVIKESSLGTLMLREHPSTPVEPFKVSLDGAYWAEPMMQARKDGRITTVPHTDGVPVDTWWDIGRDTTSIWITQSIGVQVHVIGYYQSSGIGLKHYVERLVAWVTERKYRYGQHHFPHDMGNRDWSNRNDFTRLQVAEDMGLPGPGVVLPRMSDKDTGIEAGRNFIQHCLFDEAGCEEGIAGLDAYRKEWDAQRGTWRDTPLHDWASHPADAFQQLALHHTAPVHKTRYQTLAAPRPIAAKGRRF